ncbi:hypothetical protein UlMin_019998 [Ulmus minor]
MLKLQPQSIKFLTILLLLPILVSSNRTCETQNEEHQNTSEALKYKLIAISAVLCVGAIGVCLPFLVKNLPYLNPDKNFFFLIKAFAAGVILATGFVHVLPDAYESLGSPCLSENPWRKFPFAGFFAMVSAIATLMIESLATGYHKRSELVKHQPSNGDEEIDQGENGHVHGSTIMSGISSSSDVVRNRIISQVLELGIVVHSVIIGITLGASQSPKTIKPLVAALSFHQFFEGIGLGGCIYQSKLRFQQIWHYLQLEGLPNPHSLHVSKKRASQDTITLQPWTNLMAAPTQLVIYYSSDKR